MNNRPRKRLTPWRALILYVSLGLAIGFLLGLVLNSTADEPQHSIPLIVSMYLGVLMAVILWLPRGAKMLAAKPRRDPPVGSPFGKLGSRGDAPREEFIHRLAHYLHCEEDALTKPSPPYESKMPFWSLVDFRTWCGPKPAWLIRQVLERIRASVHKNPQLTSRRWFAKRTGRSK